MMVSRLWTHRPTHSALELLVIEEEFRTAKVTRPSIMVGAWALPNLIVYGTPEVPPIFSGFAGVLLCTLGFASIGMAVSSFTENQIVAGVSSMVTLLLLYVIQAPAESLDGTAAAVFRYLSPVEQVQDFIHGVVTLKSTVYFLSMIGLGLFMSQRALDALRWR